MYFSIKLKWYEKGHNSLQNVTALFTNLPDAVNELLP